MTVKSIVNTVPFLMGYTCGYRFSIDGTLITIFGFCHLFKFLKHDTF